MIHLQVPMQQRLTTQVSGFTPGAHINTSTCVAVTWGLQCGFQNSVSDPGVEAVFSGGKASCRCRWAGSGPLTRAAQTRAVVGGTNVPMSHKLSNVGSVCSGGAGVLYAIHGIGDGARDP